MVLEKGFSAAKAGGVCGHNRAQGTVQESVEAHDTRLLPKPQAPVSWESCYPQASKDHKKV